MKKIILFLKQQPYIIYILCLIPLVITNIYLYKKICLPNNNDLYIHRYLFAHSIYVNLLILFFSIMLTNSLKNIINNFRIEFTILLKVIFFGLGCFFMYAYCNNIDIILSKNSSAFSNNIYYFFYITTLSFCSLLIFYYFSFVIKIKFPKKEITTEDEKTINDTISTITDNTKSNKDVE